MANDDPSGSVQVACVRLRPLELKELDRSVPHESAAVCAADDIALGVDSATAARDAGLDHGRQSVDARGDNLPAFIPCSSNEGDLQGQGSTHS
jgi:hypothetical protein